MTYPSRHLSRSDRRDEREAAEERSLDLTVEGTDFTRLDRCPWCRVSVRGHSPDQLERCEAAFQSAVNRQLVDLALGRRADLAVRRTP